MKTLYDNLAVIYGEYYIKHGEEKLYQFVFNSSVALSVLPTLYERFVKEGIESLEQLPQEKKENYWKIACRFFTEQDDRIKASKCVYVLALITSNEES